MKPSVKDNFLASADYDHIKKEIFGDFFPWYFHSSVVTLEDKKASHFFWTHVFFDREEKLVSSFYKTLRPLFNKLKAKTLIRIKANMYSNQGTMIEHDIHSDYPFKHKGALFSLNTCNGFTTLGDGTKIKSVGNSILFFDPSIPHHSSTCTNAPVRVNINFNYF